MRHRKAGIKLNRTTSHRNAMFRNMVTSLFKYDRIRTTDAKAKELRRWADHIITLAKQGDLHARRRALSVLREKNVVHKLFAEANERFGSRNGGYTRIIKMGRRPGDAASISLVELIIPEKAKKKKKDKTGKTPKEKKPEIETKKGIIETDKPEKEPVDSIQPESKEIETSQQEITEAVAEKEVLEDEKGLQDLEETDDPKEVKKEE